MVDRWHHKVLPSLEVLGTRFKSIGVSRLAKMMKTYCWNINTIVRVLDVNIVQGHSPGEISEDQIGN